MTATATRPDPYVSEGTSPPGSASDTATAGTGTTVTAGAGSGATATDARPAPTDFRPGFSGLRCRACGTPAASGPVFVCTRCFGPLEATYDLPDVAGRLTREVVDARDATIWRYAELLPVESLPTAGLRVGLSPLVPAPRLASRLGLERLWIKDDSRNPTLSFKDRVVGVAAARAVEFGFHTLACASTGNLSASVAAAAASLGLEAVVFIPADLEPAKVAQARALGATVVRVDGPYDAVNRLCLELTDELEGWAVVNVNLRPYYAEGSKTIAFEIAQQLGWRAPDVVVAPLASGSLYTKLARGFGELVSVGLLDGAEVRYIGGQPAGCAPIANAFSGGEEEVRPIERPQTIVRSLAIGSPADGRYSVKLARSSGGAIHAVDDGLTVDSMHLLAESEGILTETAGGVTLSALRRAIEAGTVGRDDEVVLVITGNGLKTLDVLEDVENPLSRPIAATFDDFMAWWDDRDHVPAA
jgi:threonine synthase